MNDVKWLKESVEKIENKVDQLGQKMEDQNVILSKQAVILEEHQRRSLANEENVAMLRTEFRPVQQHVALVGFVFKVIGFFSTLVGCVAGVVKIVDYFSK